MKRPQPQAHWTETNLDDYKSRITFDFLDQLTGFMEAGPVNQKGLAIKLGIGESAVSQIFNNPNNLTLKTIIKYARALGLKVSLLAYDDNDPDNTRGPIGSDVFNECWVRQGKPSDAFDLKASTSFTDQFPARFAFPTAISATNVFVGNFGVTNNEVLTPDLRDAA
ncbi:MAG: helix-turn-helix transcriptional regulator [Pyrinomonadaceae bacterium]